MVVQFHALLGPAANNFAYRLPNTCGTFLSETKRADGHSISAIYVSPYLLHANKAKKVPNAWSDILEKLTVAQAFKNIVSSQGN